MFNLVHGERESGTLAYILILTEWAWEHDQHDGKIGMEIGAFYLSITFTDLIRRRAGLYKLYVYI